jgi:spermidine/putrescine transport system permease protein
MAHETEVLSRAGRVARVGLSVYGGLIFVFLFAPIALLVLFSFNASRYGSFPITGWTLHWYSLAINDYQIHDALSTTLSVALRVTIVSVVVGTSAAFPLVRSRLVFRDGIRVALMLPIMIPGLLIGVSLLVLLVGTLHQQLSTTTAVIGQSVYTTPFVMLVVASRLQRLRLIVLPLLLPAILAGALFAFTLSLDEFIITYFLVGTSITLPIYIYTQVKYGITPEVNALASMLLAASLMLLALAYVLPQLFRAVRRILKRRAAVARTRAGGAES